MADFDYGNTRLRVMKARLFSPQQLTALTAVGSVERLLNDLTKTGYRPAVEAALVRTGGMACLHDALNRDLVALAAKVRRIFAGSAAALVALLLRRYDVDNVKAILRGLSHRMPAEEIVSGTLPLGDLQAPALTALAGEESMAAAVDLLATWRSPFAEPLLAHRSNLFAAELALSHWYFNQVAQAAEGTTLATAVALEADVTNLLTALRLAGAPQVETLLQQLLNSSDVTALFVPSGRVPVTQLADAVQQESVPAAVGALANTPFGTVLQAALPAYQATERLTPFERTLLLERLRAARRWLIRDVLGIGVLWGYLALKTAEITNLRLIGQGLYFQDEPTTIRDRLLLA